MKTSSSTILYLLLAAVLARTPLCASCGSASCPLASQRGLRAGTLQLSYFREYIDQDRIYVGSSRSYVGAIRYDHDEVRTINERETFHLAAGLSERIGLSIDLPFVRRQHSHIHHDAGGDQLEQWNFSGLGDVRASCRISLLSPGAPEDAELSVLGGVKLPTGVTDFANAEGETAEIALQPGSGSTDAFAGLQFRQDVAPVPTLSGEYSALPLIAEVHVQWNGRGPGGWRFGSVFQAHLGTAYEMSRHVSFLLQLNGKFVDYADVGSTGEPRENTGGSWLFLTPGLDVRFGDGFSGFANLQLPVYQDVHGIQQTSRFNLQFGLSAVFSVTGE